MLMSTLWVSKGYTEGSRSLHFEHTGGSTYIVMQQGDEQRETSGRSMKTY